MLPQRVLPVAFADKGFDPFKLLSSDLMQLSLAQQKAFLSLLLATTAASQRNSATNSIVEAGGFGSVYKHSKPLLKMMIGCRVDHIRDNAHLLASRLMVSTGAFESNTWETTLWLGHLSRLIGEPVNTICKLDDSEEDHPNQHILGSIGECVVGFLAEAVSSVGRTLYKYFDELFSLLSAHSLGEGSTEQSKGLSGTSRLRLTPIFQIIQPSSWSLKRKSVSYTRWFCLDVCFIFCFSECYSFASSLPKSLM